MKVKVIGETDSGKYKVKLDDKIFTTYDDVLIKNGIIYKKEIDENILNQMNNCVCRIYNKGEGTGFFTKIPFKSKLLPVLITNNHIININFALILHCFY